MNKIQGIASRRDHVILVPTPKIRPNIIWSFCVTTQAALLLNENHPWAYNATLDVRQRFNCFLERAAGGTPFN